MASDQSKADSYIVSYRIPPMACKAECQAYAQRQVDYVMGNNPMNGRSHLLCEGLAEQVAVYMVGMHPNSPQNPHSAPASGGDNIGDIRNDPPVPAHVLYGAVVGGPLENYQFWDWRDDWVQTEVGRLLPVV